MSDLVSQSPIILEVRTPIGKKIRMHDSYWQKILNDKHKELKYGLLELKSLLVKPDQVRISIKDDIPLLRWLVQLRGSYTPLGIQFTCSINKWKGIH